MKQYLIPPDIKEKEKIVGGIFTKTQFIFVVIGAIFGLLCAYLAFNTTGNIVAVIIALLVGVAPFVPFAFVTIRRAGNVELFVYLKRKFIYKKSQKDFMNISETYTESEELNK